MLLESSAPVTWYDTQEPPAAFMAEERINRSEVRPWMVLYNREVILLGVRGMRFG